MFQLSPEVRKALDRNRPVVALESTLIAHGFDYPENIEVGRAAEAVVRDAGAIPATIALVAGIIKIGLTADEMLEVAQNSSMPKLSLRDVSVAAGLKKWGATTVASTAYIASLAGITVFSTGGLGGVHRGAKESWDVSADLLSLSQSPIVVVCSGAKSILDIPATLEVLESYNIPVLGYQTDRFPGFYVRDSGYPVPWQINKPSDAAQIFREQLALGLDSALVVANPVPEKDAVDKETHDKWIEKALAELKRSKVTGKAVTPFMLHSLKEISNNNSVKANRSLIFNNAALAAEIAKAI
ncbi:MAG TPA: pseudouridine-5-phosphate glycosidase [Firmicutes bacterium]|jgi:pseudouridine-5'-phosphate glycosidase|nr:pseudouridine-5-phosphate glycosidase [Bacillota bacterium]